TYSCATAKARERSTTANSGRSRLSISHTVSTVAPAGTSRTSSLRPTRSRREAKKRSLMRMPLAPHEKQHVPQLVPDKFAHAQFHRAGRAGQRDHDFPPRHAGGGTSHHSG